MGQKFVIIHFVPVKVYNRHLSLKKIEIFEHHSFSSCSLSSFNIPDSVNKNGVC